MHKLRQYSLLGVVLMLSLQISAQTTHQNTGWLAWFNSYKFSKHWRLHFDGQVRSADKWDYVRTLLVRPGITYAFNARNAVTLGYAYIATYNQPAANASKTRLDESRIWEQYINSTTIGRASLQNRVRLEQRFIERTTENVFSQRLRYWVRTMIPFIKPKTSFNKGFFGAIQNEIFFNVQNKDKINESLFDQNRVYLAIGYRFSPKIDIDAGYMNQFTKGATNDASNNIVQLALYTRL